MIEFTKKISKKEFKAAMAIIRIGRRILREYDGKLYQKRKKKKRTRRR